MTDTSGWGFGFAELLGGGADCTNLAQGGRSSRSYRSEGWWQKCLESQPDYLLIQFGHNDQPGKGPKRESAADTDFRDHLRKFVTETQAVGIQPILVTPLTRRRWDENHKIKSSLAAYAQATTIVATELGVPLLDLHRLSIEQANELGPEAFRAFEPMTVKGADHTHLNREGSRAVARIVVAELVRLIPKLIPYVKADSLRDPPRLTPGQSLKSGTGLSLTETAETISVSHGETQVLVYNKKSPPVPDGIDAVYARSGFLHPVASPAGGGVTAAFPFDHPHQHGIFSAWVRTTWNGRDIDFWNLAGGTGRVLHQRVVGVFSSDEATGFEVDSIHRAVQPPVVDVLRERWKVSVYPTPDSHHCFDIETTQTALTEVPLVVSKYHYGGMALRGPTQWLLPADRDSSEAANIPGQTSFFVNDAGSDRKQGNHEPARWVALSGVADGAPVSIAVLCHRDNFRAPQTARLHPTKPYFCFTPCVTEQFVIDRQHPLHARYRYLVTDAVPNAEWLDDQWRTWCGPDVEQKPDPDVPSDKE